MALSSTDLWNKYVTELTNYITGGQFDKDNQVICFSGNTSMIDLVNSDSEITNYNIYGIGNSIPKSSPAYAPQGSLIGAYSSFLNYINLGGDSNPNLESQLNNAARALTTANENFSTQSDKSWDDYQKKLKMFPDLKWPTYLQQYGSVYIAARDAMTSAKATYYKLLQQKSGANFKIIADAQTRVGFDGGAQDITTDNSYNMLGKADSADSKEIRLPGYHLDSAFTTAYQEWQSNSVSGIVNAAIDVSGTTTAKQYSEFGWDASIGGSCFGDFFSVFGSGSASGQTIKQSWQSTNFNLKMSYTGLQSFKINPYTWFEQNLITEYKNNLLDKAPNFFGKDGALNLLPYEIIVGFEPKLELTLDNSDYSDFKDSFHSNATASLSIGPFRIGSASTSTYSEKNDVSFSDETNTITIGPIKSTLPLLLGVICSKLQ